MKQQLQADKWKWSFTQFLPKLWNSRSQNRCGNFTCTWKWLKCGQINVIKSQKVIRLKHYTCVSKCPQNTDFWRLGTYSEKLSLHLWCTSSNCWCLQSGTDLQGKMDFCSKLIQLLSCSLFRPEMYHVVLYAVLLRVNQSHKEHKTIII